ncbi:hypothetical protein RRG08_046302 [Elysia crispata]|uniref:Uncharacterized protein n=1 Tax=Elysia crispata TaxID=231223 RepID=A0AAE1A489_9GAST|nr:hypothetical protein RRG08_046302 [Elysia crispata]
MRTALISQQREIPFPLRFPFLVGHGEEVVSMTGTKSKINLTLSSDTGPLPTVDPPLADDLGATFITKLTTNPESPLSSN